MSEDKIYEGPRYTFPSDLSSYGNSVSISISASADCTVTVNFGGLASCSVSCGQGSNTSKPVTYSMARLENRGFSTRVTFHNCSGPGNCNYEIHFEPDIPCTVENGWTDGDDNADKHYWNSSHLKYPEPVEGTKKTTVTATKTSEFGNVYHVYLTGYTTQVYRNYDYTLFTCTECPATKQDPEPPDDHTDETKTIENFSEKDFGPFEMKAESYKATYTLPDGQEITVTVPAATSDGSSKSGGGSGHDGSGSNSGGGGGGGGGGVSIGGGGSSSSGGSGSSSGGSSSGGNSDDGDDSSDDSSGGDSDSASNSGFYIRPTSRAKTCEAGSQEVVFYNGVPDKVSYSGNGITSATLGGTVNFSANESTEARSFAVTWTVTGSKALGINDQSGTLTITQAGTGELAEGDNADKEIIRDQITGSDSGSGGLPGLTLALAIDPSHCTATASGAVFLVAVETLYGWSWATSASWVSLSRYSDYYALVVVDANTAEAARSGTVVFTDEAGSKATLYIAQAGTGEDAPEDETPWLNLFPTTLYGVDNTARQWTVYTTASEKFMLHPATTIPDWLTVTLPYRDGAALTSETDLCEDYLQIVATRNGDTEPRYAQFDFCFVSAAESSDNPEIAATLYIGQAAYVPPDNSLNFEFIEIGAAAESLELGGVCRDGWTWTVDTDAFPDWIDAVSIATGTGNDEAFSVELAVAENTSSEPRWATFGVVFTNPDTGDVETKSVTVYQRAADNSDPQDIEIVSGSELEFDYSGGSQTIVVKTSGNAAPIVSATGDEDAEIVLTESAVSDEGSLFTYTVTLGENTLTRALSGSFTFTLPAENGAGWMVATWKQGIEPPTELRTYVAGIFVNRSRLKFFCRKWSS